MQRFLPVLTLLVAWSVLSVWLYGDYMSMPPARHQAWAMSDYYAMALRFQENGFDLFHPQTYNLRTREGVTASDLPLPAWLSAFGMALVGNDSTFVFRFLTWLVGFLGLCCFFDTLRLGGVSPWRSVVLTLLMALLPCWAYYNISLLPSPWAFSAFLVGFWALNRFGRQAVTTLAANDRYFIVAIVGFTLAALLRKPFVLYLVAVAAWLWQNPRSNGKLWNAWAGGLLAFGVWQVYDRYLGQVYGSGFLRTLMRPDSVGEAWSLLAETFKKWALIWLSPTHWLWLVMAGAVLLWQRRRGAAAVSDRAGRRFFMLAGLLGLAYCLGMLRQFPDHDYYGIDAFYPALFVGVAYMAIASKDTKHLIWAEIVCLLLALGWTVQKLDWYRVSPYFDAQEKINRAYYHRDALLDSLKIGPDAKILVFEAYSDNAPLVGLRRTGYCLKSSRSQMVEEALLLPWDYAMCLDTFFVADLFSENPGLVERLQYIGGTRDLMVFRRAPADAPHTLSALTGIAWKSLTDTTFAQPSNAEFLLTQSLVPQPGGKILFGGKIISDQPGELKATVALFKNGEKVTALERSLKFENPGIAVFRSTEMRLPAVEADEMRLYIWNPNGIKVALGNFKVLYGPANGR